jgi:hypothetical protein
MPTIRWALPLVVLAGLAGSVCADQKEALMIVNTAIQAHGGEAALRKAQMCIRVEEGTRYGTPAGDLAFTNELTRALPDKIRLQIDVSKKKIQTIAVLNGDKGWLRSGGSTKPMAMLYYREAREDAVVQWQTTLLPLIRGPFTIDSIPGVKVEGEETVGFKVEGTGYVETRMYFYKRSGLLAAIHRRASEDGVPGDKEFIYSSYKNFDGVRLPGKETHIFNGKKVTELTVRSYKFLERADDSAFEKP